MEIDKLREENKVISTSINFVPISIDEEFTGAVSEYKQIWEMEGVKILNAFQKITGLKFLETQIDAEIYDGKSFSGKSQTEKMRLRFSYDIEVKKGTLIHELSHRLLFNLKNLPDMDQHEIINLFLYDVWVELYGSGFADKMVEIEKKRAEKYLNAWNYALSISEEQRKLRFKEFYLKYK